MPPAIYMYIARMLANMNRIIKEKDPIVQLTISTSLFYGVKAALLKYMDIQGILTPVELHRKGEQLYIVLQIGELRFHQPYSGYWKKYTDLTESEFVKEELKGEFVHRLDYVMDGAIRDITVILFRYGFIINNKQLDDKDFKFLFRFLYPMIEWQTGKRDSRHGILLTYNGYSQEYKLKEFRKKWRQETYKLLQRH